MKTLFFLALFAVTIVSGATSLAPSGKASVKTEYLCKQLDEDWLKVGVISENSASKVLTVLKEDGKVGLYSKIDVEFEKSYSDDLRDFLEYRDDSTINNLRLSLEVYSSKDKYRRGIEANLWLKNENGDIEVRNLKCQNGGILEWDRSVDFRYPVQTKNSQKTLDVVKKLGDLANGYTAYRVNGKTVKEIVTHFANNQDEVDSDRDYDWDSKKGPEGETGTWGSMDFNVAQQAIGYVEKNGEYDDKAAAKMMKVFSELKGISTIGYSWHPSDYSYCGAIFTSVAIIDLEAGILYIIHQGESGPC